ncbi:HIT domain-containing protein [Salinicola aestuarinus]|uniref:HIT domain-containing protein n=1 Tax=Salinicola aestuarinus TaxID=1949082 RepID=UPI000DA11079|nr:HIT domain-containing protein [Salinicola aestuarinus]
MPTFTLDDRLERDSVHVVDLSLSQVRLSRDARYPWLVLVPRRADVVELFDLDEADQRELWREATALGQAMMTHWRGDKLNVATLGNVVAQLHVHVIVRFADDPAWPGPVWGQGEAETYAEAALDERCETIRRLARTLDAG